MRRSERTSSLNALASLDGPLVLEPASPQSTASAPGDATDRSAFDRRDAWETAAPTIDLGGPLRRSSSLPSQMFDGPILDWAALSLPGDLAYAANRNRLARRLYTQLATGHPAAAYPWMKLSLLKKHVGSSSCLAHIDKLLPDARARARLWLGLYNDRIQEPSHQLLRLPLTDLMHAARWTALPPWAQIQVVDEVVSCGRNLVSLTLGHAAAPNDLQTLLTLGQDADLGARRDFWRGAQRHLDAALRRATKFYCSEHSTLLVQHGAMPRGDTLHKLLQLALESIDGMSLWRALLERAVPFDAPLICRQAPATLLQWVLWTCHRKNSPSGALLAMEPMADLLGRGADLYAVPQGSRLGSPLHSAIRLGRGPLALLLDHGLQLHPAPPLEPPLHAAVRLGNADCVDFLLTHGANCHFFDAQGTSALALAHALNSQACISLMSERAVVERAADCLERASAGLLDPADISRCLLGMTLELRRATLGHLMPLAAKLGGSAAQRAELIRLFLALVLVQPQPTPLHIESWAPQVAKLDSCADIVAILRILRTDVAAADWQKFLAPLPNLSPQVVRVASHIWRGSDNGQLRYDAAARAIRALPIQGFTNVQTAQLLKDVSRSARAHDTASQALIAVDPPHTNSLTPAEARTCILAHYSAESHRARRVRPLQTLPTVEEESA